MPSAEVRSASVKRKLSHYKQLTSQLSKRKIMSNKVVLHYVPDYDAGKAEAGFGPELFAGRPDRYRPALAQLAAAIAAVAATGLAGRGRRGIWRRLWRKIYKCRIFRCTAITAVLMIKPKSKQKNWGGTSRLLPFPFRIG